MEKIKNIVGGPIAQRVIRVMQKESKSKIIDFRSWKIAKNYQEDLEKEFDRRDLSHPDPLHALYTDTQHRISEFIEMFSELKESEVFNKRHNEAEDIYLPSGPPMSPLTGSYFFALAAFDMYVGLKRETYTTVMLECCKKVNANPNFMKIIRCMQDSRMGFYVHQKNDDKFVYLKELYTNSLVKTQVPANYYGIPGEIWFVRLLPDPFEIVDYSIAFTTPYVIIDMPHHSRIANKENLFYSEEKWIDFIERHLIDAKRKDGRLSYHDFMKYGLSKHYWPEYVFQAYVNHTENNIWLTGFPDKPETLPHS